MRENVYLYICIKGGFPGGSVVKNPPANAGDAGSISGSGRSSGGENCNSLQYSCLENPMDRGAWKATQPGRGHKGSAKTAQQSMSMVYRK